jgi:hypothetical protein
MSNDEFETISEALRDDELELLDVDVLVMDGTAYLVAGLPSGVVAFKSLKEVQQWMGRAVDIQHRES